MGRLGIECICLARTRPALKLGWARIYLGPAGPWTPHLCRNLPRLCSGRRMNQPSTGAAATEVLRTTTSYPTRGFITHWHGCTSRDKESPATLSLTWPAKRPQNRRAHLPLNVDDFRFPPYYNRRQPWRTEGKVLSIYGMDNPKRRPCHRPIPITFKRPNENTLSRVNKDGSLDFEKYKIIS